jgi:hypothetical protein
MYNYMLKEAAVSVMMWEILVPRCDNDGTEIALAHHQAWDAFVRNQSGGLTILKPAKGNWVSPDGQLFVEPMIPVRIMCGRKTIVNIAEFTMKHYQQLAVLVYLVSSEVMLIERVS